MKFSSIRPVCIYLLAALLVTGIAPRAAVQAQPASPAASALLAPAAPSPHPILSEGLIRRGLSHCTNKAALAQAAYPALTLAQAQALVIESFVPMNSRFYTPPYHVHEFDIDLGRSLISSAGWVLPSGATYREKNGKEMALTLTVVDEADPVKEKYLPVFVEQMRACGVHVILNYQPSPWFYGDKTGVQVRDFEMSLDRWAVAIQDPGGALMYACDKIPTPANNWSGHNWMGWCNQTASNAIVQAANQSLAESVRKEHYATFINEYAIDAPGIALFVQTGGNPNLPLGEHIDFNLETYMQSIEIPSGSAATLNFTDFSGNPGSAAVPSGALSDAITLSYTPLVANAHPAPVSHTPIGAFRLAVYARGLLQENYTLQQPVTLTLYYSDPVPGFSFKEDALALYFWNGAAWQDASTTCPEENRLKALDPAQNRLRVNICHLSEFSLIAGPYKTYISMAAR